VISQKAVWGQSFTDQHGMLWVLDAALPKPLTMKLQAGDWTKGGSKASGIPSKIIRFWNGAGVDPVLLD